MSAESQSHPSHHGGHVVSPQPMSDKSIIESVAGFINDVVPQGYTSSPIVENKEQITWARFEYGDINDPVLYPDSRDDRNNTAPLLLVLGYGSGVQVWAIPVSGEATEVLSWRQGTVRTLRVLPTPATDPAFNADIFAHKRPLVALCDCSSPGAQYCSVSFVSLRAGDQVKSIKFKNPVNDVLANRRSVIVTFSERIAVFDALTLEDRLTITTCYPSPGPNPNPVALGSRWLAYAERRLIPSKRCSGGTEGEGVQSYTATVLHAAKSLGKGLRELGETVASSLTGSPSLPGSRPLGSLGSLGSVGVGQGDADSLYPGVVTIIDAKGTRKENGRAEDNVIAHFTAHGEAIVALQFDPSGMLLLAADKRGHDFHLFRIQPHPGGSSLAAVHHLYVLHRGDTTAKVQDMAFASDSRWVAVSTLRGTTHVFPITPYGGSVGLRTHSTPHVVNRLSRFHRSAGLSADGRNSPQAVTQAPECPVSQAGMPYSNPRLPPYPQPTTVHPLAQIRQLAHLRLSTPSSPNPSHPSHPSSHSFHRNAANKSAGTRHQSSAEENAGITLKVSACFAPSRAWLIGSPTVARDGSSRALKKPVESLFVMACHGNLVEYELDTKHATGIPKEKVCDDTAIELEVQAKARWLLVQLPHSAEVQPPLPSTNPLMVSPSGLAAHDDSARINCDERWLSHVEIVTHAGPHRRLWMGPQFTFKTYTANAGVTSLLESDSVEIGCGSRLARSNPVNMPLSNTPRPVVPFLIESGSGGSYEQSPRLVELYGGSAGDSDSSVGVGETQLREELADAMMESPGRPARDAGRRVIVELRSQTFAVEKIVNPLGSVLTVVSDQCTARDVSLAMEGSCVDSAVRWPSDVVKNSSSARSTLTDLTAQHPADRSLGSDVDSFSSQTEKDVLESPPRSSSARTQIEGRKKSAASGADVWQAKPAPREGETRTKVRSLKSGDKASRSKPWTEHLPSADSPSSKEKTRGEKAPQRAPSVPTGGASADAADPATKVPAEIAQCFNDGTSMTELKTDEELIPLPLEDTVFNTVTENLTNEVSSCSEEYEPLERVSKSKLYAVEVPEMRSQGDFCTEISCDVADEVADEGDGDGDGDDSDPVADCGQEINKVSFNCSDDCSAWTASIEPLSSLDFIEPACPKLWSRITAGESGCEKLRFDEIPATWPDLGDGVTAQRMEGSEIVSAVNTPPSNEDADTLSLLQASKKNKKKNKRRR